MAWVELGSGTHRRDDGARVREVSLFNFVATTPDGVDLKTRRGSRVRSFTDAQKAMAAVDVEWPEVEEKKVVVEVDPVDRREEVGGSASRGRVRQPEARSRMGRARTKVEVGDVFDGPDFPILVRQVTQSHVVFRLPGGESREVPREKVPSFLSSFELRS